MMRVSIYIIKLIIAPPVRGERTREDAGYAVCIRRGDTPPFLRRPRKRRTRGGRDETDARGVGKICLLNRRRSCASVLTMEFTRRPKRRFQKPARARVIPETGCY